MSRPSCSRDCTSDLAFFEQAVLELLVAMGYGGADGRATRTQLSNDGIIDQDALGLSRVYVQAKRYALDTSVGRPEIQGFVGALHGQSANRASSSPPGASVHRPASMPRAWPRGSCSSMGSDWRR